MLLETEVELALSHAKEMEGIPMKQRNLKYLEVRHL
jgi:hypothetical protein